MNMHAPLRLDQTSANAGWQGRARHRLDQRHRPRHRARARCRRRAVVLNGFGNPEDIAADAGEIVAEFGVKARYSPADMSKAGAIAGMIAEALEHVRPSRHPGQQCRHPARRADRGIPAEKWDAILAINLSSAFHTTRAALPAMRKNVGPHHQHRVGARPGRFAVQGRLRRRQARHRRPHQGRRRSRPPKQGITCNAICPGYVYTPLVEAQIEGQAKSHGIPREQVIRDVLLAQQPNKRFATVEELGALSVFLASDAAASITGIALPVDGGWTAH